MKINMHTSHPSAFISSTFVDLYDDRVAIADSLKDRGLNVNALDIRPASNQSSKHEILNGIKESDFVILIIGDRFGSILKSMTGSDSQSITWWEYSSALKMDKPIIVYFKNVDISDSASHDDKSDPFYNKKRKLFEHFKKIVTNRHNPSFYSDSYDLAGQLDSSLISIYRAGVKKLCARNTELNGKVSALESEIELLETKLAPAPNKNSLNGLLGIGLGSFNSGASDTPNLAALGLSDAFNKSKT